MKKNYLLSILLCLGFSLIAQTTYVPDDNFEQALIDLGYDDVLDDYVLTANISSVTTLLIESEGISDLTGIEGFTALRFLYCGSNNLSSLDVNSNTALHTLYCDSNNLSSLDVSSNTALKSLDCYINNLSNLDVSSNTALEYLYCDSNNLSSLDVSSNTVLIGLSCGSNNLSSLDVSSNTVLEDLFCGSNNLSSLDVSLNIALESLHCFENNLSSLNIKNGNNTAINNRRSFKARNNPNLSCIEVDDATYSTTNWTNIDATASFSEDCNYLSVAKFNSNLYTVYPNPVTEVLHIQSNEVIDSIRLLNMYGAVVLTSTEQEIDLSQLPSGMYILEIISKGKVANEKIIKN